MIIYKYLTIIATNMDNIIFSNKALAKMKTHKLSEVAVRDTFSSGTFEKPNKMIKKYSSYEIGLFFVQKPDKYIITTVWMRYNRR